ncbi:hypothetical protein L1857_26220 [Amycolatopsis thermalba]|uniref:Uncharacterized protein n=1 Tax=Amycolatopsis thermalba TaxID=944492 RepID=A0ABY4P135_9PSEU|nr:MULTISPECIES: hypothetical protein [Amycolatopsis]UQS26059.1 hypothetical protein L1857_26220 [Amycolatopsis thermalba]
MSGAPTLQRLIDAATGLSLQPRGPRWSHLSLCVLDAVFSIGARYSNVTRLCWRYANYAALPDPLLPADELGTIVGTHREQPLDDLVTHIRSTDPEIFASTVLRHRGRTSTRNGILKAEAVLHYADILTNHHVDTIGDIPALLSDDARLAMVEDALRRVPGNGGNDVRLNYLWMVSGDDHRVKPDRMVLRWLTHHLGQPVTARTARELLAAVAARLSCTPWELDHAIWRVQSGRR